MLLAQAPALAIRSFRQLADGTGVEQFWIDGRDEDRCELAAHDLALGDQAGRDPGTVREIRIAREGAPEHSIVVDRNDIVYRVTEQGAVVDRDMTAELRGRRQAATASGRAASPSAQDPVVINDGFAFRAVAGQVLHGLSAVRARNGIAIREIERLVKGSGEQTLESACQSPSADVLLETFGRIIGASQQIDALLEAIGQRTRTLLRLAEAPSEEPADGRREAVAEEQIGTAPNPGFSIEGLQSARS